METITFPRDLYFGEAVAAGEADSFPYKPKNAPPSCNHPARVTYLLLARTKANTAAKATAREQFVYGYMRSLRE